MLVICLPIKKPKEERIEEITDAALKVFLKKGYEGTTMDSIAREANISKGGLYHHFQSKEVIFLVVNQKISENISKLMYQSYKNPQAQKGLSHYIKNYLKYWLDHPTETSFLFQSIGKMLDNPELLQYYKNYTEEYVEFMQSMFQKGINQGEFIEHDTKTSALTLIGAMDGILSYMIMDDDLKLERIVQDFEKKFIVPLKMQSTEDGA